MRGALPTRIASFLPSLVNRGRHLLFARFFVVGAGSAMGYILLATLLVNCGVTPWLASGAAYFVFIPLAYILQRNFAFRSLAVHFHAFPRYLIIQAVGAWLSVALPYVLGSYEVFPSAVMFGIVAVSGAAVTFFLMKLWAFKASAPDQQ
jgi:putative flippase GtrA